MNEFCLLSECDQWFYLTHGYLEAKGSMYDDEFYVEDSVPNMAQTNYGQYSHYESIGNILKEFRWSSYVEVKEKKNIVGKTKIDKLPYLYGYYHGDNFVSLETDVRLLNLPDDIKDCLFRNGVKTFKQVIDQDEYVASILSYDSRDVLLQFLEDLTIKRIDN